MYHTLTMTEKAETMVREAMLEGMFYPSDEKELRSLVASLLARRTLASNNNAQIIICPKASYFTSGEQIALGYLSLGTQTFDRIIILSDTNHYQHDGIHLPESTIFRTPLGDSLLDEDFVRSIQQSSTLAEMDDIPHLHESGIEIQLPFVQYLYPQARLVPILVSGCRDSLRRALLSTIKVASSEAPCKQLIIVSTNLSLKPPLETGLSDVNRVLTYLKSGDHQAILAMTQRAINCQALCLIAFAASLSIDKELKILDYTHASEEDEITSKDSTLISAVLS